jgi:hypothetical protein
MDKILELLQKGMRHDRRKAKTFFSVYETDNQQTWEPLELELQLEGIKTGALMSFLAAMSG